MVATLLSPVYCYRQDFLKLTIEIKCGRERSTLINGIFCQIYGVNEYCNIISVLAIKCIKLLDLDGNGYYYWNP